MANFWASFRAILCFCRKGAIATSVFSYLRISWPKVRKTCPKTAFFSPVKICPLFRRSSSTNDLFCASTSHFNMFTVADKPGNESLRQCYDRNFRRFWPSSGEKQFAFLRSILGIKYFESISPISSPIYFAEKIFENASTLLANPATSEFTTSIVAF
jgi:hypothetical protein